MSSMGSKQKTVLIFLIKNEKFNSYEHSAVLAASFEGIASETFVIADSNSSQDDKDVLIHMFEKVFFLAFSEKTIDIYKKFISKNADAANADRIIFLEDAWFGAVYPLTEVFENMKNTEDWCLLNECPNDFMVLGGNNLSKKIVLDKLKKIDGGQLNLKAAIVCSEVDKYTKEPSLDMAEYLISEKRLPLIRKKLFTEKYEDVLERNAGENAREALDIISKSSYYDSDLIIKYLLATKNMADIKKTLQLNCMLSSEIPSERKHTIKKIALMCHLYYQDQAEFVKHYINSMPNGCDVFITVPNEECRKNAEAVFKDMPYNVEIRVIGNRGRDVGALLTGLKDVVFNYDLICSVHDKKVVQLKPYSIGESWAYKCFENLLKNKIFVENIIAHFEDNPYLGIAEPPAPLHADYYAVIGYIEWGNNYDNVIKLAKRLGVKTIIEKGKEPVAPIGTMFWFRPEALRPLYNYDWNYEDYPKEPNKTDATLLHAIERFYQFAAQAAGFYTEWIMADKYAQIEEDNLDAINHVLFSEELKISDSKSFKKMNSELWKKSAEKK